MRCIFATDLHGRTERFGLLFDVVRRERPDAVLLGGDLFPRGTDIPSFMERELFVPLRSLPEGTEVFAIMGNDDRRDLEHLFMDADREGILHYVHLGKASLGRLFVRGYSFVPPSPFRLKDWEKRDRPGGVPFMTVPPEEGITTIKLSGEERARANILEDLSMMASDPDLPRTIFLCHAPPHGTDLDKVGYDAPGFDPHVGSRAIREFIEETRPLVSLHGHIHESTTVTGSWKDMVGSTLCINGATEGPQLCLVRFDPEDPGSATRDLYG